MKLFVTIWQLETVNGAVKIIRFQKLTRSRRSARLEFILIDAITRGGGGGGENRGKFHFRQNFFGVHNIPLSHDNYDYTFYNLLQLQLLSLADLSPGRVTLSSHASSTRCHRSRPSSFPSGSTWRGFVRASRRWCSSCCSRSGPETSPVLCSQSPSSAGSPGGPCTRRRSAVAWGPCPSSSTWCCRAPCGSVPVCRACARREPDTKGICYWAAWLQLASIFK